MNILVISDGKYGDRAADVISKKFPTTEFILIQERNVHMLIDHPTLSKELIEKIKWADLLIIYVRHPDVVMKILEYKNPAVIAVDFGKGFLKQARTVNPQVVMPEAMCNVQPNTGIREIDEYFSKYGFPTYEVELEYSEGEIPIIKNVNLQVESPCGASVEALNNLIGKKLIPDTITNYGVNIRHECREPISIMLTHKDIADSSASLHIVNLLNALEDSAPELFGPETDLGKYAKERRKEYKCLRQTSELFED